AAGETRALRPHEAVAQPLVLAVVRPGIAHAEQVDLVTIGETAVDLVGPRPRPAHAERAAPALVDELQDPHRVGIRSLSFLTSCSRSAFCWASSLSPVLRSEATMEK